MAKERNNNSLKFHNKLAFILILLGAVLFAISTTGAAIGLSGLSSSDILTAYSHFLGGIAAISAGVLFLASFAVLAEVGNNPGHMAMLATLVGGAALAGILTLTPEASVFLVSAFLGFFCALLGTMIIHQR